jgi:hypothetical protein
MGRERRRASRISQPAGRTGMFRNFLSSIAILAVTAAPVCPQTSGAALSAVGREYSFSIPAAGRWIDTGIDLQKDQIVQISPAGAGCVPAASSATRPLPLASSGALIAKLSQDATPLPFSARGELKAWQAGHLYLGLNGRCPASVTVKVAVNQMSQADRLKQQLASAAAIWLQGQLGNEAGEAAGEILGNPVPASSPLTAASLKVSTAPLDPVLRKDIDSLPRRVNDRFKNMGDMVNFVLVGSESQVKSALAAANWHVADTSDVGAVASALDATYQKQDYLAMPMSTLYLFGHPQDYGYEMAEPIAMVASRHHFRLWKAPFTWDGETVWAGAGTHDIGFAKDKRNGSISHKIDPNLDGERTNIGQSLDLAGKVKSMEYYLPPNPVQEAKNATGDSYASDGKILVILLK